MNLPGMSLLAKPLGYLLWIIYQFIGNYFVSIFLFTLLVRAATFPLSIKSQKMAADRARLAPRLERLQKKYAQDKQKLQQKQMELYEKEGVSMTGGCLPMLVQMIVLFGIIAVIYAPLTYLNRMPDKVLTASMTACKIDSSNKNTYRELRLLMAAEDHKDAVVAAIDALPAADRSDKSGQVYYERLLHLREDFSFFGKSLLENPWNAKGFKGINMLWLIPLLSGLTALGSSFISMRFMNAGQTQQPGQGCTTNSMLIFMPLFSLYIAFSVPGGVGIYWICSNIIAVIQTIILNMMYNPAKIRAKAEIEYEERRKQKLEDKKRLAEARARDNAEWVAANNSGNTPSGKSKAGKNGKDAKGKADSASANPADTDDLDDEVETVSADDTDSQTN